MSDYVYADGKCPSCGGSVGRDVASQTGGECPECYEDDHSLAQDFTDVTDEAAAEELVPDIREIIEEADDE